MDNATEVLTGVAAAAVAGLAAFIIYRWRQRERVRSVKAWVKTYVVEHYDGTVAELRIDCSDDRLWPVSASFLSARSGLRHRLEFNCSGRQSSYALISGEEGHTPIVAAGPPVVPVLSDRVEAAHGDVLHAVRR